MEHFADVRFLFHERRTGTWPTKSKTDFRDRDRVSGDEEYEVGYFASKFGLSIPQVRELIAKHGNDRETLEAEAKRLGVR
ncbi:DUF3606 domain-containing protein [Mesorhizobium sp. CA14]|uniref:DUF3606 domain-containing protein n=1 Tax=Mesorhizobium sp. CA14 TaxID=2876642 RepID=UPI00398C956A